MTEAFGPLGAYGEVRLGTSALRLQFSVEPALPPQVMLDSTTGVISGSIMAMRVAGRQYAITARWSSSGEVAASCYVAFAIVSSDVADLCNNAFLKDHLPAAPFRESSASPRSRVATSQDSLRDASAASPWPAVGSSMVASPQHGAAWPLLAPQGSLTPRTPTPGHAASLGGCSSARGAYPGQRSRSAMSGPRHIGRLRKYSPDPFQQAPRSVSSASTTQPVRPSTSAEIWTRHSHSEGWTAACKSDIAADLERPATSGQMSQRNYLPDAVGTQTKSRVAVFPLGRPLRERAAAAAAAEARRPWSRLAALSSSPGGSGLPQAL